MIVVVGASEDAEVEPKYAPIVYAILLAACGWCPAQVDLLPPDTLDDILDRSMYHA
jgi:hypothetical protein